jgi:hypothetical protein
MSFPHEQRVSERNDICEEYGNPRGFQKSIEVEKEK